MAADQFMYSMDQDKGLTGRFEVTLYKTRADLDNKTNGQLIHSKKETGEFPFKHKWDEFQKTIKEFAAANTT